MFDLTEQDVFRLTEFFAESDLEYLHITAKDVEIVLARGDGALAAQAGPAAAAPPAPVAAPQAEPSTPAPATASQQPAPPGPAADTQAANGAEAPGDTEGTVVITAPSVGVFYRAPSPDQPPYIEVGDTVEPETTVALIEAMKVFAGVTAGVKGTVVEVLAENNALVEHGQALFRVAPAD